MWFQLNIVSHFFDDIDSCVSDLVVRLCLIVIDPPNLHVRLGSMPLRDPQCFGILSVCQFYHSAMLSRNLCLLKTYPNQDGGKLVNQLEAPFCGALCNARSMLLFIFIYTSSYLLFSIFSHISLSSLEMCLPQLQAKRYDILQTPTFSDVQQSLELFFCANFHLCWTANAIAA